MRRGKLDGLGTAGVLAGAKKWGKKPHRSQPIPADLDVAKPLGAVPHVVQRDSRLGLIAGPSLWEPEGRSPEAGDSCGGCLAREGAERTSVQPSSSSKRIRYRGCTLGRQASSTRIGLCGEEVARYFNARNGGGWLANCHRTALRAYIISSRLPSMLTKPLTRRVFAGL